MVTNTIFEPVIACFFCFQNMESNLLLMLSEFKFVPAPEGAFWMLHCGKDVSEVQRQQSEKPSSIL